LNISGRGSNLKIVHICQRYHPDIGGIETHVKEICEMLIKKGFDVEVVCTDASFKLPKHETINGVKVTRFWTFAPRDAFFFSPQIYFYLKGLEYDVIHVHNYHTFLALFAALANKTRLIFTPHYHGGSHSPLRNLLLKPYYAAGSYIFEKAEKVVCVSRYEMKLIKNDFNIPSSKLVHIPNGLNLEEFKEIKELKKESKNILYAGRLESYKGVNHIIEALTLLKDYRLKIIGKGPHEKKLRELALKLKVNDKIDWLKDIERSELLAHFKSADVFVNLSTFEAYGITVAEALACGTPCIVVKKGALEEFIDGKGCIGLSYPIDVHDLVRAIKIRERITPRKMLGWDDITSDLIKLYYPRKL